MSYDESLHSDDTTHLEDVQCEDESERAERLLPSREVRDVLPALLGRHDAEDDAFREWIQRVDEFKLCVAAERDHLPRCDVSDIECKGEATTNLVHLLELHRNDSEALHKLLEALIPQVVRKLLRTVPLRSQEHTSELQSQ
mgnify:CR=1 FL=1